WWPMTPRTPLLLLAGAAAGAGGRAAYLAAVRALLRRNAAALMAGDPAPLLRMYAEDAELVFPGRHSWGRTYRGKGEIEAFLHRHHPRALPGVHDVQHRLNLTLTGPGTVALLAFGAFMATRHHLWGQTWVTVPLAILAVIVVAGGAIVRWTAQLAELAHADV